MTEVASFFGLRVDALTLAQTADRCIALIEQREEPVSQVSINAAKIVQCEQNAQLAEFVDSCDVVSADGQAVVWAGRLLGYAVPERVAGIDLMEQLLERAVERDLSVFILGATDENLARARQHLISRHPRLRVAGVHHGYFGARDETRIAGQIRQSSADLLFVAMGSPQKEQWIDRNLERSGVRFAMGVGGAIDVLAGDRRRAPAVFQRLGLEWLYRLIQDPRAMWRRYLVGNARFGYLLCREVIAHRWGRVNPPRMRDS